ncbi:MAG: hypothetical protein AAFX76_12890, partial [Planctomycetota bacterium]
MIRLPRPRRRLLPLAAALIGLTATPAPAQQTGSVIFFHPDGASAASWAAARALFVGPDDDLNW